MKQIEKLHLDVFEECYEELAFGLGSQIDERVAASKSAEMTKDIAIKFAEFVWRNSYVFDGSSTINKQGNAIGISKGKKYCRIDNTISENNSGWTTEELFEEFIKTL